MYAIICPECKERECVQVFGDFVRYAVGVDDQGELTYELIEPDGWPEDEAECYACNYEAPVAEFIHKGEA